MRQIFPLLACLACAGYGRRMQSSTDQERNTPFPMADSSRQSVSEVGHSLKAIASLLLELDEAAAFNPSSTSIGFSAESPSSSHSHHRAPELAMTDSSADSLSRRAILGGTVAAAFAPRVAVADEPDVLDELPPKAKQAYLQYLPVLQVAGDAFAFDLYPITKKPAQWQILFDITIANTAGSAVTVSRLERDWITPMKILGLAFPPDLGGEEMQEATNKFQLSMTELARAARAAQVNGNTAPPTAAETKKVTDAFDNSRKAWNSFLEAVNGATGAKRLAIIPPNNEGYPRSEKLYQQLIKDAALCRGRGGETLGAIWGQLMVYGTVPGVNPCGYAAPKYYAQGLK